MESGDDGLESEANVRPRPRLTGAGQPRGCPAARWTAINRGLSRDPLGQARLNRSAKGAGTGHSPRYPKCETTQSDRLLVTEGGRRSYPGAALLPGRGESNPGGDRGNAGTPPTQLRETLFASHLG